MRLRDVLGVIRRSWLVLLVCVLVALGVGWGLTAVSPVTYETETKVLVNPAVSAGGDVNITQAAAVVADQIPTYAALAMTPSVLDPAIAASGVDVSSTTLIDDVTAAPIPDTSIIVLTVQADSGQDAASLANAISASLIEQVESQGGAVGVDASVVEDPEIPDDPASPRLLINLAAAFAVGLLVAFLVIVFRQALAVGSQEHR
jgi:capsular polysaccharide biosynthesis protein